MVRTAALMVSASPVTRLAFSHSWVPPEPVTVTPEPSPSTPRVRTSSMSSISRP